MLLRAFPKIGSSFGSFVQADLTGLPSAATSGAALRIASAVVTDVALTSICSATRATGTPFLEFVEWAPPFADFSARFFTNEANLILCCLMLESRSLSVISDGCNAMKSPVFLIVREQPDPSLRPAWKAIPIRLNKKTTI